MHLKTVDCHGVVISFNVSWLAKISNPLVKTWSYTFRWDGFGLKLSIFWAQVVMALCTLKPFIVVVLL
mgnify:CR=1 FL=1